ncbi:MAG TPA: hypothetical protein VGK73_29335, partial [Polyangiaceae bacterium]
GVAGAFFVHGLLNAANVFSAPRARHALRRHRERLQRGKPSPRELKRIEADFLQSERPVSHGLLAVPLGLGAAVAVLPAFDDDSNGTEQTISIVGASVLALGCLFSAITLDLTSSYLANIEASGLELSMTPSRMDLAYRF